MGHQKAAFEVMTKLFTPQTVMQTPVGRVALMWYARFDIFIGIMGSFGTSLSRDWFVASMEYYDSRTVAEPQNLAWKIEASSAQVQLIAQEMSDLFAKGAKQEFTDEEYAAEHRRLSASWEEWKKSSDITLNDPAYLGTDFPTDQTPDADDIVNPFAPGVLFRPPLFASTLMACEYHSTSLMHASQSAATLTDEDRAKLMEHAYAIYRIAETVELWPHSPPEILLILQSCLGIAALYLRRDPEHHMWIRKKFALLERMG
jgi:hypothetical protein